MDDDYKNFDCYKILAIPWTASPQEVRKAYYAKCKECHPDVGGTHEQQIKVNLAYEILSDPIQREQHDRFWKYQYQYQSTTRTGYAQKPPPQASSKRTNYESYSGTQKTTIQQLFVRVSKVIDQELNNLREEGERWVRSKISDYEEKVRRWMHEQETAFKQKYAAYEAKLNQLRQQQTKIFNQKIAGYDRLRSLKNRMKSGLFFAAIGLSVVALMATALSLGLILFSFDKALQLFGPVISVEIWAMVILLWFWYANAKWVKVYSQKVAVEDPDWKHKIIVVLAHIQNNQKMKVSNGEVTINAPDSLNRVKIILQAELFAKKMNIGPCQISYDSKDWQQRISNLARDEWQRNSSGKEESLKANRDKYIRKVADICDLVDRNTTLDSSEEQVARRIAVAFFLMGYFPVNFDGSSRMFVFSDGDAKIIIRFRHRSGAPTNIAFVKRMVSEMHATHAPKGFLFCTPGLSGNADDYARANSIKWYSLEAMNSWINNVLSSGYQGPPGNIFQHIDRMTNFLRQISLSLPRG